MTAGTNNPISSTNGNTRGAGAYCARNPASSGPNPSPPAVATVETNAALRRSPCGSSSVSVAVSGPVAAPIATPCRMRPANSHPVPDANANTSAPHAATNSAGSSMTRYPMASAAGPTTSSEGIRTAT